MNEKADKIDDKKLNEETLRDVSGGDGGVYWKPDRVVINQNGTDFCFDPSLITVLKHLDYKTQVCFIKGAQSSSRVRLESGESGYVRSEDLYEHNS